MCYNVGCYREHVFENTPSIHKFYEEEFIYNRTLAIDKPLKKKSYLESVFSSVIPVTFSKKIPRATITCLALVIAG